MPKRSDQDVELRIIDKTEEERSKEEVNEVAEHKRDQHIEDRKIDVELANEARLKIEAEVELMKVKHKLKVRLEHHEDERPPPGSH